VRLAIISDIHEDILNLRKILKKIEKAGYDQFICLGDISGFSIPFYKYRKSRNAGDCLSLVREKCNIVIPGNHDLHAARKIPKHSAIFDFPSNWYDLDFYQKSQMVNGELWLHEKEDLDPLYSPDDIEYIRSLPEYQLIPTQKGNVLFSHYVYPNLSGFKKGFYHKEKEFRQHFEFMKEKNCLISFTGHAHVRGFYTVSNDHFRHYGYKNLRLKKFPVCIGIHPVTRHKNRSGFCIFDVHHSMVKAVKC